ncbi:PstS family phosphate ABC transporter substrate-binding protein [Achromobacter ruhlandii]|uniref:PstS family phosphate ABC transporter substrate-binding protein n=1 Tax=Achromobacter ruhlandii TaxID=72557 RepID=UPI001EEED5E8|nr:substrate-binding domain-containing protein [Achromobacter ruhlandii]
MSKYISRIALPCLLTQACASGIAVGQTIVSGGAGAPLPLYQDAIANFPTPALLPYVAVDSPAGLRAFLLNAADAFGRAGPVHWVGSETPLTQAQIADYLTRGWGRQGDPGSHGPLIQIPVAYVPITISYKGPSVPVTLSHQQLCAIFSGAAARWSQLGVAVAPSLDAFKLVYRADGSGTTGLLTRHLGAVCGTDGPMRFAGKDVFRDEFPPGPLPSHFVAAVGDGGAAAAMAGNVSAITYIGPDPAYTAGLKQAWLVNAHDGVAYLPTPANVIAAMESSGAPMLPDGPVLARGPGPAGWLAPDNPRNPANWVRILPDPQRGYPIAGSTNLVLSQCYTDALTTGAMRLFLKRLYDDPAAISRHQLVPLPVVMRTRLLGTFVSLAGTPARLNLGNPTVCGDVAGRG